MKPLIKALVETAAPSGYEKQLRELIHREIKDSVEELKVDAMGNLIARKKALPQGRRLMLAAHIDEIGIMVTHVDEDGFARFTNIGGVFPRNCVGAHVRFINGAMGVIGIEREDNRQAVPPLEKMYIDTGAANRAACPVKTGDVGVFDRPFLDLGKRLVSKAMDDRIGVVVLIETCRQLKESPYDVYFVFSAQEEVGTRGAIPAAYGIDPQLGLAVDVTHTGDTPKGIKMDVALGKGAAIKVRDSGMLADPRVVEWMADTAQKHRIPYQLEVLEAGSTDARSIQVSRAGVPSGCLSIPARYIHTPSEMVDIDDVQAAVNLLLALLSQDVPLPE